MDPRRGEKLVLGLYGASVATALASIVFFWEPLEARAALLWVAYGLLMGAMYVLSTAALSSIAYAEAMESYVRRVDRMTDIVGDILQSIARATESLAEDGGGEEGERPGAPKDP